MNRETKAATVEDSNPTPPGVLNESKSRSLLVDLVIRLVREKPLGTVGGVLVILLILTGIFADVLTPYAMDEINLIDRLQSPSFKHLMGTDELGRDTFTRVIHGARISMTVGLAASALATVISAMIGIFSGYLGGRFDMVTQRFVDAWLCFPGLFLVLSVMAVLGPGLVQVIVVLGVTTGIGGSRTIRGAVIGIKENQYVLAAQGVGATNFSILLRHVLPNVMAPIIVLLTTRMAWMIIEESTISFLGFGIPPPTPSWGGMLSGGGLKYMLRSPWLALWPGLALAIAVYSINMLGDAVRDLLDPSLRGGTGSYKNKKK